MSRDLRASRADRSVVRPADAGARRHAAGRPRRRDAALPGLLSRATDRDRGVNNLFVAHAHKPKQSWTTTSVNYWLE